MSAKLQTKNWAVPIHKGAVKALKEVGAWSDDQEKHNNALLKRQEILAARLGGLHQGQPAGGRRAVHRSLDEGTQRRAGEGEPGERVRIGLITKDRTPV